MNRRPDPLRCTRARHTRWTASSSRCTPLSSAPLHRRRPRPRLSLRAYRDERERADELYEEAVERTGEILVDILRGRRQSVDGARKLVGQFLGFLELDTALLPGVVQLAQLGDEYLFNHGINVSLLAMTAAAELALPPETVLEIGLGAMLQDVGMMRVSRDIRLAPRWLSPEERDEVNRHPIYTLDALETLDGISQTSLLISYQSHERGDCSGYPRHRHHGLIHPSARLVAATDAFAALCAHRPHRNARGPYESVEILLRDAGRGRFDRVAVRTFLDGVSLFPVGSYVRLSDGRAARVLRASPGLHTRPQLIPLNDDGTESDTVLDLTRVDNVFVVQALRDRDELSLRFFDD